MYIRTSFVGAEHVYTNGSCYRFYKILRCIDDRAIPYYDGNHVITRIGDRYYDITGEVECGSHIPLFENYGDLDYEKWTFDMNQYRPK